MDNLTKFFLSNNIKVLDYFWNNTSLWLGHKIEHTNKEIVYHVKDDIITVVIYRRINTREKCLANPFKSFLWFVETTIKQAPEVRYITGKISALTNGRDNNILATNRLVDFYCRIMGGVLDINYNSSCLWFDLNNYKNVRQRKQQKLINKKGSLPKINSFPRSYK